MLRVQAPVGIDLRLHAGLSEGAQRRREMRLRQIAFALTLIDLSKLVLDVCYLIGSSSVEGSGRLVIL